MECSKDDKLQKFVCGNVGSKCKIITCVILVASLSGDLIADDDVVITPNSVQIGRSAIADNNAVAVGSGTIAGQFGTALGPGAQASFGCVGIGWAAQSLGWKSVAIGNRAIANGEWSLAFGADSETLGYKAFA